MSYRSKRTLLDIQATELNASKAKNGPPSDEHHPQSTSRTPISRLSSKSALFVRPSPSQPAPSASRASISRLSSQSAPFVRHSRSQPTPSVFQAPISRLSSHSAPSQRTPSTSRARLTNFSKPPPPDQITNLISQSSQLNAPQPPQKKHTSAAKSMSNMAQESSKRISTTVSQPKQATSTSTTSSNDENSTLKWSDDVHFDEDEKIRTIDAQGTISKVKKSLQPRDVELMENGIKVMVDFNEHNQPLGKGGALLVRFLGYLARNERFCPIGFTNFHQLSKQYKADIIELVHSKFHVPESLLMNKAILQHVNKHVRQYRHELKKTSYKPTEKTMEEIYNDVPDGHTRDNWRRLVDYWNSEKGKTLAEKGKGARASQSHFHTTGATSYANIRATFVQILQAWSFAAIF